MSISWLCLACCILCYAHKDGLYKKQKIAVTENATLNAGLDAIQSMRLQVSNFTKLGVVNICFMLELEINKIIMKVHDALHNPSKILETLVDAILIFP